RQVGLSRTVFATRFAERVGMPPLRYLAQRRLREAARLLSETDLALAQVAERVGYAAEASFSRAFKRFSGRSPAGYRPAQRAAIARAPQGQDSSRPARAGRG